MNRIRRKKKVLFVCTHNSGRAVMATALLNHYHGHEYEAQSAELHPGPLNPMVVDVLAEKCIDISGHQPTALFDVIKTDQIFANVITICDDTPDGRRPIFPGVTQRLEWSFPDPLAVRGTKQQKRAETRKICEQIKAHIETDFLK